MKVRFRHLPGIDCTDTATVTVDGYSPRDGLTHGSLDAVVHVCAAHHQDAMLILPVLGMPHPYTVTERPQLPHVCGHMVDFRDTTSSDDQPPSPQHVVADTEGLGLLDPMPYRLTINGEMRVRGTLQQIQGVVAELVTTRLAADPAGLAPDAQMLNQAFTQGAVKEELDQRGIWYTIFGLHSAEPVRIRISVESSEV